MAASLPTLAANAGLQAMAEAERQALVEAAAADDPAAAARLTQAGMTWEAMSGWLGGPMDAAAWTAVMPSMGYMAMLLLRNLRNFDQAGVGDAVAEQVAAKLADLEQAARSRHVGCPSHCQAHSLISRVTSTDASALTMRRCWSGRHMDNPPRQFPYQFVAAFRAAPSLRGGMPWRRRCRRRPGTSRRSRGGSWCWSTRRRR